MTRHVEAELGAHGIPAEEARELLAATDWDAVARDFAGRRLRNAEGPDARRRVAVETEAAKAGFHVERTTIEALGRLADVSPVAREVQARRHRLEFVESHLGSAVRSTEPCRRAATALERLEADRAAATAERDHLNAVYDFHRALVELERVGFSFVTGGPADGADDDE